MTRRNHEEHNARIVVGMDDSAGGRAALEFAMRDAARRGSDVQVVTAFEIPVNWAAVHGALPDPAWPSVEDVRATTEATTARAVDEVVRVVSADLGTAPDVTVTAVGGSPAAVLVRAAERADLLVVGSRGRGGLASSVLGSVGLHCVLHAGCPVTVVHTPADRASAGRPAELTGRP